MASPEQIYRIYTGIAAHAAAIRDDQTRRGEKVSGTVNLLLSGDRGRLLRRWQDEMEELCGVLAGRHDDPYILESTQVFYWASLYAVSGGTTWAELGFADLRQQAARTGIEEPDALLAQAKRLAELGPDQAKPAKLYLLWWVADLLYRRLTPGDRQWSLEQIMEYDLQEMKKRPYLQAVLEEAGVS